MKQINRRTAMQAALAGAVGVAGTALAQDSAKKKKPTPTLRRKPIRSHDEVRQHLTGPIASIATPFNKDGSVDYKGLRNLIDFDINAGTKTILLTAGDSQYTCLSDDEIAEVTRVTVDQTAGRAMVVAADRYHSTDRAVEFAKFSKSVGADVQMCLPPNWGPSCTPQTLADHYTTVAKVMPVMIVTNVFAKQGAAFGLDAIKRTFKQCNNIVAIKDDMCGSFAQSLCLLAHKQCALFAGGQKKNHLNMHPFGVDGYMSTYIQFYPKIAHDYWAAIQAGDVVKAWAITNKYDVPFFDFIVGFTGGWNAAVHGIHELYKIAKRWRRKPYYSLNDEEMEKLADFLRKQGVL